jgi:hypothetical protein
MAKKQGLVGRDHALLSGVFSRPFGTGFLCRVIPALKRRAILGCPSGTERTGRGCAKAHLGLPVFPGSWQAAIYAAVGSVVLAPNSLLACAACYGQSDSPLAQGMNWGIASLLGTILLVLGGIAGFFVGLARRAAAVAAAAEPGTSVARASCPRPKAVPRPLRPHPPRNTPCRIPARRAAPSLLSRPRRIKAL